MRVWKIVDDGCPICSKMSQFDADLIAFMGYELVVLKLDEAGVIPRTASYIRSELMDADGTVDIPMYIVEVDGDFVGAVVGQNTKGELKRKLLQVTG
jgi:hypothetical protein